MVDLVHELEGALARNKSKEKGSERLGVLTLDPLGDGSAPSELGELVQTLILGFDRLDNCYAVFRKISQNYRSVGCATKNHGTGRKSLCAA